MGLRRLPRLQSKKPKLDNGNLLCSLHTNLCDKGLSDETPKSFQERVLYAHKKVNTLFDSTVNIVQEIVLSIIDNKIYYLKDMLKQKDKSEFIKAMEYKIDLHERRNHWEIYYRDEILQGIKSIISIWTFKRKRLPDSTLVKHKTWIFAHSSQ